ncbi:MAG: porin [bacterium]
MTKILAAVPLITTISTAAILTNAAVANAQDSADLRRALDEIERLKQSNAALAEKVGALEERVAEGNDAGWLTEQRAAEVRAIVTDVLADAGTRTSLADGATAGYDAKKGFFLASADGNYTLQMKGETQIRWAYSARDIGAETAAQGSPSASTDEDAWGFEIRRMRMTFFGTVVDPSWYYEVKFEFARSGGAATLSDAFVEKRFENGFNLRVGQFKGPFLRESIDSATGLLAVERSLVDTFFTVGRPQGMRLAWESDVVRIEGFYGSELAAVGSAPYSIVSGSASELNAGAALGIPGSQNSGFNAVQTDYAFIGRIEAKTGGEWKQFKDMQSFRGEEAAALFGVGAYAQQVDPVSGTDGATADVMWSVTADARVDFGGASIFVYGVYRDVSLQEAQPVRGGGDSDELQQWGAVAQGGYFVTDDIEAFLRYEIGNSDTDKFRTAPGTLDAEGEELSLVTVGANWWPAGVKNRIKISGDFGYAFSPIVDFAASGADWLPDYTAENGGTSDGEWVIRTQLQLTF